MSVQCDVLMLIDARKSLLKRFSGTRINGLAFISFGRKTLLNACVYAFRLTYLFAK